MKVNPASVHFLAKVGFSLNWTMSAFITTDNLALGSYKAVSWMYALTPLLFRDLYYAVSIEICGRVTEVHSVWRAQGML
jgi:hypothetical protein